MGPVITGVFKSRGGRGSEVEAAGPKWGEESMPGCWFEDSGAVSLGQQAVSANRVTSDRRPERRGPQSYNRIELSFASNLMSVEMDSLLVSREGPLETSWHLQFGF